MGATSRLSVVAHLRSFPLLAATLLLLPFAGATGPLPKQEVSYTEDHDVAVVQGPIFEKQQPIPERCTPRPLVLCVGPYDPDIDVNLGTFGVHAETNGTNVTAIHDPARHWDYGPYEMQGGFDRLRICTTPCQVPNSFYGWAEGNVSVVVYFFEDEVTIEHHIKRQNATMEQPDILARSCRPYPRWYDCTTLL